MMKYFNEGIIGEHVNRHLAYTESVGSVGALQKRLTLVLFLIKLSIVL